jgi:hypothetical protein
MSQEPENEKKKIIIDEDWKSQVQAEKEAAEEQRHSEEPAQAESATTLPPPSMSTLLSSLYLQVMVALGLLPGPASDKPQVRLAEAKYAIDMLEMLQEKTEGNRTPEETEDLGRMLHESRLAYVGVQQQQGQAE